MVARLILALALSNGEAPPLPMQPRIFYNARLAARDQHPEEVLKLWLLHNAAATHRDERGTDDPDFLSLVWASLGDTGLCPDGLPYDERGAGLWPLALHNWLVRNLSQSEPSPRPAPFDAFDVGKQQRFVSLHDVLSGPELRSVTFFRGDCLLPWMTMLQSSQSGLPDLKDRLAVARLLRTLLQGSRRTLVPAKVEQREAIEARIFDLDLLLSDMEARKAGRAGRALRQRALNLGVARTAEPPVDPPTELGAEEGMILRASLHWTPDAWLSLTSERRLFMFAEAKKLSRDPAELHRLIVGIIDALIERRAGNEIEQWVAASGAGEDPVRRRELFFGPRGLRLLGLDRTTGFRERPVIALHRGVSFLEGGDLREAMRSFAYALSHAEDSRESSTVLALSRRWLSYVLARHETTDEVIATLTALVPRTEYNVVIEDLVWRAALHADLKSFTRCTQSTQGNSAFDARMTRLRPLAEGKLGDFANQIRSSLVEEPSATLRFLRQLIDKLEGEDGDVRRAHTPTLRLLIRLLSPASGTGPGGGAQARVAIELSARCQSVLDGLQTLDDASPSGERRAQALSPSNETFAGSIRLAPTDPLPWPFSAGETTPPSALSMLRLVPVEWRGVDGHPVMGWRISE